MEGDYATELGTDGSLLFVCVETKHAGKYDNSLYIGPRFTITMIVPKYNIIPQ